MGFKLIKTGVKGTLMTTAINRMMVHNGRKSVHALDDMSKDAVKISEETLMRLLDENKDTEYGQKYGFADIHSIEDYKKKVPLSDYDTYAPYIERMVKKDEGNLLSVSRPVHYAVSSGSIGVPKYIPVSEDELEKYKTFGTGMVFGSVDEYYRNTTGKTLMTKFGFNMIQMKFSETKFGIPKGAISGNVMKQVKDFAKYFISPPWDVIVPQADMDLKYLRARFALERKDISFIDGAFMTAVVDEMDYICNNWEMLCRDIHHGRIDKKIEMPEEWREKFESMLKPNPKRARKLYREFKKGKEEIIPRIWPEIKFVAAIGTGGFFTYYKKMRMYTGRNVPFANMSYAASEGLFATARHVGDTSYVLIPNGGFYEFIPADAEDETETLTIDQLEEGEKYEIVITNLSGFYRYRIKDVVRVTGFYNQAPMLEFVYRKNQVVSIAGEKTNGEVVDWSIQQAEKETGLDIHDFSIYADTSTEPGHYTFIVELPDTISMKKREHLRNVLEQKMMTANPSFGEKIRTGVLGKTELVLVQQQTYQLYRDIMVMKGTSPNQLKPVRVIDTPIKHDFFFGLKETD
ncbi:MAG: GH3 auxin-responsive promoter family protein [Eubacterium sp.]|nr:GH3 auxin-responsive promoter family protein [Eubacterium sp.]